MFFGKKRKKHSPKKTEIPGKKTEIPGKKTEIPGLDFFDGLGGFCGSVLRMFTVMCECGNPYFPPKSILDHCVTFQWSPAGAHLQLLWSEGVS